MWDFSTNQLLPRVSSWPSCPTNSGLPQSPQKHLLTINPLTYKYPTSSCISGRGSHIEKMTSEQRLAAGEEIEHKSLGEEQAWCISKECGWIRLSKLETVGEEGTSLTKRSSRDRESAGCELKGLFYYSFYHKVSPHHDKNDAAIIQGSHLL